MEREAPLELLEQLDGSFLAVEVTCAVPGPSGGESGTEHQSARCTGHGQRGVPVAFLLLPHRKPGQATNVNFELQAFMPVFRAL